MLLSVIIAAYENVNLLLDTINSVIDHNDLQDNLEIIVSDNSVSDNVKNAISNIEFKNFKYIHNENRGFGYANNCGFNISQGKYLLFLNPDTLITDKIFLKCIEIFKQNENIPMFGIRLLNSDHSKGQSYYFIDNFSFLASLLLRIFNKFDIFISKKMYTLGADIFITRKAFSDSGMFDTNFFMYSEEADLTKRVLMLNNKYKNGFFKNIKIVHIGSGTTEQTYESILKQHSRLINSEIIYSKKYKLGKKLYSQRLRSLYLKKIFFFLTRKVKNYNLTCDLIKLFKSNERNY